MKKKQMEGSQEKEMHIQHRSSVHNGTRIAYRLHSYIQLLTRHVDDQREPTTTWVSIQISHVEVCKDEAGLRHPSEDMYVHETVCRATVEV